MVPLVVLTDVIIQFPQKQEPLVAFDFLAFKSSHQRLVMLVLVVCEVVLMLELGCTTLMDALMGSIVDLKGEI